MNFLRRRLRFALAVLTPLAVMIQAPGAAGSSGRLGSGVFQPDELTFHQSASGGRRDVANQPTATLENLECHITTLNPGEVSHPPHRHPQEEFILLREGVLDVFINGTVQRVGPGSSFFFATNDLHNVTNAGATPATYVVFQFTTAATHAAPGRGAAESAPPGTLRSGVFAWEQLAVKKTKTGERRDVFDSRTVTCAKLECHVTTLNPGEIPHAAHHHPDEELIVVKDGTVQVAINGATRPAGPGSVVFFASNDEHGLKNAGTVPATYYVIRVVTAAPPPPTTPS
jgi:uncharacterized cupin superfamily protein